MQDLAGDTPGNHLAVLQVQPTTWVVATSRSLQNKQHVKEV